MLRPDEICLNKTDMFRDQKKYTMQNQVSNMNKMQTKIKVNKTLVFLSCKETIKQL